MKKKRNLSFKTKHKIEEQINNELNEFIKKHKDQIVTKGKEDLEQPGKPLSAKKIYQMFKASFKEKLKESENKYSLTEARKAMKKTLHTETFTGKEQIDYENLRTSLIESGKWEEFRKLNRHQKIEISNFKRVDAPKDVRTKWEYSTIFGRIIYISLIYQNDGSFEFKLDWV